MGFCDYSKLAFIVESCLIFKMIKCFTIVLLSSTVKEQIIAFFYSAYKTGIK